VRPLQACGGSLCVGQEGEAAARRRAGQDDVAGAQALDSQEFAGRRVVVVLLDGGEIQPARVEPGGGGASGGRRPRREEDDLRLVGGSGVAMRRDEVVRGERGAPRAADRPEADGFGGRDARQDLVDDHVVGQDRLVASGPFGRRFVGMAAAADRILVLVPGAG
jgi:hypothetical protein